jgi:hypothetical protein
LYTVIFKKVSNSPEIFIHQIGGENAEEDLYVGTCPTPHKWWGV